MFKIQELIPVRCCCSADNLIGYLPSNSLLELRELETGEFAFDSNDNEEAIRKMSGFVKAESYGGVKTTWKKTWKKK